MVVKCNVSHGSQKANDVPKYFQRFLLHSQRGWLHHHLIHSALARRKCQLTEGVFFWTWISNNFFDLGIDVICKFTGATVAFTRPRLRNYDTTYVMRWDEQELKISFLQVVVVVGVLGEGRDIMIMIRNLNLNVVCSISSNHRLLLHFLLAFIFLFITNVDHRPIRHIKRYLQIRIRNPLLSTSNSDASLGLGSCCAEIRVASKFRQ